MDITTYDKKEIRPGFEKASEMMSVALSVRKNREEALGTHLADLIPSLRVVSRGSLTSVGSSGVRTLSL